MKRSLETMQSALRVLEAVTERRDPPAADMEQLTHMYGPIPSGTGVDEWACDALQSALKHRATARKATH